MLTLTEISFLQEPAVIDPLSMKLTDDNSSISESSFLNSQEEELLQSWISEIVRLNNTWSLIKGRFYYGVHQLLKGDTVKSQVYGNFASLCETLRKNYRLPGASRGYELKRAYEQYLYILRLGVEFPSNCRLTAELFLALEKIPADADDLRLEAAQWCIEEFSRRNGIVDVPDLIKNLEQMQERYPEREVLRMPLRASRRKRNSTSCAEDSTGDSRKSFADWQELESLAQTQNRRIREQQNLLDEMILSCSRMEKQLVDISVERDRLRHRNHELEQIVANLQKNI
jgi:hypothetical protein